MSDTSFQIGDIVRLKSGGPEMTLEKYDAPFSEMGEITETTNFIPYCVWFDSTNRVMRGSFASICLEKVVKNTEIGSAKQKQSGGLNDGY